MVKAKLEPAKAKKEAMEVMEKYKASDDFMAEKARAMVDFHKLEEFFIDCQMFSQEAYEEGFRTGGLDCQNTVLNHFQDINLDFLEEEELEEESIDAQLKPPWSDCYHT